jgi:hypothetical protein
MISKCPECPNDILCFEDHDTMKINMSALIFDLGDENQCTCKGKHKGLACMG